LKLVITDIGGGVLTIEDFNAESLFPLLDSMAYDAPAVLTFALDTGTAYIPKRAVARIDAFDSEESH
jgi:hypothetical protein